MKLSTVRWILWGLVGVIALLVLIGFLWGDPARWIWYAIYVGIVYTVVKLIFWRCPHCGKLLGNLRLRSKYCYYCEKNIEE